MPVVGPPAPLDLNQTTSYTVLPLGPVVLQGLHGPEATYLVPVPETVSAMRFVAYVSEGSVLLPLPKDYILGNGSDVFMLHAPFVLLSVMGLAVLSWWILCILMGPIHKYEHILTRTKSETGLSIACTTLLSMCIILILISTIVLWQVTFLVSWSIHITTCATHLTSPFPPGDASTPLPCT